LARRWRTGWRVISQSKALSTTSSPVWKVAAPSLSHNYVQFGQVLDQRLATKIESDTSLTEDRRKFLQEEVLFPLRQRVLDLQQQLAVNQQGVITAETVVRNNRATAATFALAAQTQKQVLRGVQAVNKTTDELINQTAERLRTQGVEIQKQASQASLDVDNLKAAFANVQGAQSARWRKARKRLSSSTSLLLTRHSNRSGASGGGERRLRGRKREAVVGDAHKSGPPDWLS